MENEIWKDVPSYEGLYQVSNYGRVKSLSRKAYNHFTKERIMTQVTTKKGYKQVRLHNGKKSQGFRVHRLVANTFISNSDNKPQVNHIDGNKQNNCVDNLEWVTPKQNMRHAVDNGLLRDVSGNHNPNCKTINQYDLNGNFIKQWKSMYEIHKELGINRHSIRNCCTGVLKTSHNYIWRYKD